MREVRLEAVRGVFLGGAKPICRNHSSEDRQL